MFDIIIIGAGTAGISAYKEAVKHTNNILIINDGPWDTTCARVGCMPSKVLISTANRMHDIQNAQEVGLSALADISTDQVMEPYVIVLLRPQLKMSNNGPLNIKFRVKLILLMQKLLK